MSPEPLHTSAAIAWHRRLDTRVTAAITALVAFAIAAILAATTSTITTRSLERTAVDLASAHRAFNALVEQRADAAAAEAALITDLPVFRAHLTDSRVIADGATIHAMADAYRRQLDADFCIVTDARGNWIGRPGWNAAAAEEPVQRSIAAAIAGQAQPRLLASDERLFLVVSRPAWFAHELLGTLTVGYRLDDALMRRLADVTHCEVNLVAGGGLSASSLDSAGRRSLSSLASSGRLLDRSGLLGVQPIGDRRFAVGIFPLAHEDLGQQTPGELVLLQDWQPTEGFVADVRRGVLGAGVLVFILSVAGGVVFSRGVSHPIRDLAEAAGDIASGNWERRVPARGGAEARATAAAFNHMTTSLRHWYEEARKRDDQLRQAQKMEAIGRLAGGVAHDFNNILTAILGYGGLVFNALEPNDPRRQDTAEIIKASERAAALTRQLLAFGRRQVVQPRVLALDQVLAGTRQMLRRLIGEDIALVNDASSDLGLVRADPGQIDQILVNLAVNARDAMPEGGTLSITLSNCDAADARSDCSPPLQPGQYVRLSVSDTGCGMDAETAARIFEPFFTTKPEGRGTGLGLATVYAIAEQSGGAVAVQSSPGAGTTMHVYLPRVADEPRAEPATPAARPEVSGSETVLLVEDDDGVRKLIAGGLRAAGYTVLDARDCDTAMAVAHSHRGTIDLLLTDVIMPGSNGRVVSERVVALRPETRVMFMSGYSGDAVLRHGIEVADAFFIQKPFTLDELASKVANALERPGAAA